MIQGKFQSGTWFNRFERSRMINPILRPMVHSHRQPKKFWFFKQKAFWSLFSLLAGWAVFFWSSVSAIFFGNAGWVLWVTYGITLASFYLIYANRHELENTLFVSSQLGLIALFLLTVGFILGNVHHIQYVEKSATMLMIPAMVMTALGPAVIQKLYIPLLYWMLIIPLQDAQLEYRETIGWIAVGGFFLCVGFLRVRKPSLAIIDTTPAWVFQNSRWLTPTCIALSMLMVAPWLGDNIRSFYPKKHRAITLRTPLGSGAWMGPLPIVNTPIWKPLYSNASAWVQTEYRLSSMKQDQGVYLYSAYYDSDRSFSDMLDARNVICDPSVCKTSPLKVLTVPLGESLGDMSIQESMVQMGPVSRLVWAWYYVAGVNTVEISLATVLDNVRVISKHAQGSGRILLSAPFTVDPEEARKRLMEFLTTMHASLDVLKRPEITYVQDSASGQ